MAKKLLGLIPDCEVKDTDAILFSGEVPECITSEDCNVDVRQLTFLLSLLLERYCANENIIDADLSSINLACVLAANPDIEVPEDVTIETLMTFYKDHICALYDKISDLETAVDNMAGLICLNDLVQLDQDTNVIIDPLFNDITTQVAGTLVVTIAQVPLNGVAVLNVDKTITYTPSPGFTGNDVIEYTVTKGTKSCTARISIKVNEVLSESDINDIVLAQLIILLSSNEYWDLGIPKGTKMAISAENIVDFDFSGGSPGKGLDGTKWKKWAICNGNNLSEDFTQSTFRGFDHTSVLYDNSALAGGSDTVSLTRANLPPHKHQYGWFGIEDGTWGGASSLGFPNSAGFPVSSDGSPFERGMRTNDQMSSNSLKVDNDGDTYAYTSNTLDGTNNVSNAMEISNGTSTPTAVQIKNAYKTLILVQKVEN